MECTGSPCPLNMQQLIQVTNLLIPIVMILTLIGVVKLKNKNKNNGNDNANK